MKKLVLVILLVLLSGVLYACQQAPLPEEMLYPGDMVGDYLLIAGGREDTFFTFELHTICEKSEKTFSNTFSCDIPEGSSINITYPMYSDTTTELEKSWADFDSQVYVEGQRVNTAAFGTIDFDHPEFKKMRAWNVVVKDVEQGQFSVRIKGIIMSDVFDDTWIFTIKPTGEIETSSTSP